jgi:hypothetical protein
MSEQILVSMVTSATDTATRDYDASTVIEAICTGGKKLRGQVELIRDTLRDELTKHGDKKRAKQTIDGLKKQLPAVLWSGTFTKRANDALVQHSGLLCADLDSLDGSLPEVREKLSRSPHVWALFTSPGGNGIKAVVRVPADAAKHAGSFRAVEQHVRELTSVQIDQACRDPARLCFLSVDPGVYHNPDAREIEPLPEPEKPKTTLNGAIDLSERQRIAFELLGEVDWESETSGFVVCPGKHLHTSGDSERDCKIDLDNVPTAHCFHNSCGGILEGVNHELRSRIGKAEYEARTNTAKVETPKEAVTPRPLSALLDTVEGFLRRYVVFPLQEQAPAIALWVAHTWVIEAFDFTPYLHVWSTDKRSGKSRLLDVLELLVKAPWRDGGLTEAVLFRRIKRDLPTLLADEIDTVFHTHKNDGMENIRRMFNLGFTRGYVVSRCVGTNTKFEIEEFDPFCAKALCGIGECLPDTVSDRCIPIKLVRQSREERAARFRKRNALAETSNVKLELEAWAQQTGVIDALRASRPQIPGELQDRAEEICEPLLAIAEMAGGDWSEKARVAFVSLCDQDEDASLAVKLLADIKGIFDSKGANKLHTIDILNALVAIEDDRPWAAWWLDDLKHDKPEKPASRLAKLLKPYGTKQRPLKARPIRLSDKVARGYEIDDFKHAFERYLPPPGKAVTSVTSVTYEGKPVTASDNVTAPGVTSDDYGGNGSGSDNLGNVTALSTNVTAPVAEGVTRNPLVERPFVTDVTRVTPFREGEGDGAEDRLIEEAKCLFNAVPASNPEGQCPQIEHAS